MAPASPSSVSLPGGATIESRRGLKLVTALLAILFVAGVSLTHTLHRLEGGWLSSRHAPLQPRAQALANHRIHARAIPPEMMKKEAAKATIGLMPQAANEATIGMAPNAAAGRQKLWPWQRKGDAEQRPRRGEENENEAAVEREGREEQSSKGHVGGERRRLLATEDLADPLDPTSDASTLYYKRPRQPIWANHSDIADDLHPTVIGLGVQKSGTTALHYFLDHMTGIDTGRHKEEHFFDNKQVAQFDPNSNVGRDEVKEHYLRYLGESWPLARHATNCSSETMRCETVNGGYNQGTIDISPSYIADRRVPWIMHELLPHASTIKLLLILREPVARTLSGFFQACKGCHIDHLRTVMPRELELLKKCYNPTVGFGAGYGANMARLPSDNICSTGHEQMARLHKCVRDDVREDNKPWFGHFTLDSVADVEPFRQEIHQRNDPYQGVIFRSIYVDSIKNYLCAGFRPEQFLIMTTNELHDDMEASVLRIGHFIGKDLRPKVEGLFQSSTYNKNSKAKGRDFSPEMHNELQSFFRPYNEALLELLLNNPFNINQKFLLEEFTQY